MRLVNMIYDGCITDVDIILVPNVVVENTKIILSEFFYWLQTEKHDYWSEDDNGNKYLCVGTDAFISWVNKKYALFEGQQASIIKTHTVYDSRFSSIEL